MPPNVYPLTQAQSGLWLSQQQSGVPTLYHTAERVCLHGELDEARLQAAITQALDEAEGLHVVIDTDGEQPVQRVQRAPIPLEKMDVSAEPNPETVARQWMDNALRQPIDLAQGGLVRQALIRLDAQHHEWYLAIHHLLVDGFGFRLIQQRVAQLYVDPDAEPAFAPWSRLFEEENTYLNSPRPQQDKAFWEQRCAGLPASPPRLTEQPPAYAARLIQVRGDFSDALRKGLEQQAKAAACHWTDWIYAAIALLLHQKNGVHDIPLGMPVMGRLGSPAARVPALVMNLTLLRVQLTAGHDASQIAQAVHAELKACRRHQRYRYPELLRDLRAAGGERPFAVVVNLLPFDSPLDFGDIQAHPEGISAGGYDDLVITLRPTRDGFHLELEGSPEVYTGAALTRLHDDIMTLLHTLAKQPETVKVATSPYTLLQGVALNQPAQDVWQCIQTQAQNRPQHEALTEAGKSLTYAELVERVQQLANALYQRGVRHGQRIALLMPQGMDAICALLALLSLGAAYVPLDPKAPNARRRTVLEDATPEGVICDDSLEVPDGFEPVWQWSALSADNNAPQAARTIPEAETPAYLVYTSGSTGRPKGVVIGQGALAHFTAAAVQAYELTADDRMLHFAPLHFDASVEEIFCTLTCGATLIVRDDSPTRSPAEFTQRLIDWNITFLDLPTAYWQEWSYALQQQNIAMPSQLRGVIIGGEALHDEPRLRWFGLDNAPTLWNSYGPSEATVVATLCRLDSADDVNTIGRPLPEVNAWIADENGEPCAPDEAGELMLSGSGLALGYHNMPRQTAERFVQAWAFSDAPRSYRTGDKVRINAQGELVYLGRIDDEFKLSGHRIVPSEVEAMLLSLHGVEQAAVLGIEAAPERRYLAAFIVSAEGEAARLRNELGAQLPEALIPSRFEWLEQLPKTASGKVDRQQLQALAKQSESTAYDTDETKTERMIREVWTTVLGHAEFDQEADFFMLGGQSLQCLQVANRLGAALGRPVPIPLLFSHPRLSQLAQALDAGTESQIARDLTWLEQAAQGTVRDYPYYAYGCRTVLLTGATGFVGAALLAELLNDAELQVHCLVRASDKAAAKQRLHDALAVQNLTWQAEWDSRLQLHCGDLTQPQLGLNDADWQTLSNEVDTVVANAAQVSVMRDYQSLKAANVGGVEQLLNLTANGRPKRLLMVSTLATLPSESIAPKAEPRRYDVHMGLVDGYQQSKWVAEQRVFNAIEQGLGGEIVRLGRVTSAFDTAPNPNDLLWRILASGLRHGRLPALGFSEIWTPVDYVAAVLAALLKTPKQGTVWHLTPWSPVSLTQVYEWLKSAGYEFVEQPLPEWLAHLRTQGNDDDHTLAAFFDQRAGEPPEPTGLFEPPSFDPAWHDGLKQRAEPSAEHFHAVLAAAQVSGLIPKP
ncbi:amino acid adenylation domain-containing protein [Candidatus Albibeggiatoa sp. nov. NOAA]|uniref:amino acid adenylation domain-containing protein n=1 Tax=Candidatus Albibeggiatoa sp. nov. NOAA TaxID=3162724 RepID=UPI0032F3E827|nr:amino acid adenylation domain-containing protein [Thiotrichaceae bacterium]